MGSSIISDNLARLTKGDYANMAWRKKFAHAETYRTKLSDELDEIDRVFPPSIRLDFWDGKILKYELISRAPQRLESSLTLGDCLHNYRSSLDALYFSVIKCLADRHGRVMSEYMETSVQFPIWTDALKFETTKGLVEYGTTVLREDLLFHQPFKDLVSQDLIQSHPLEQLRLLSNKDRHRQLNLVQTVLSDYALFHEAGIQVTSGRRISRAERPNEYLFEFNVENGKTSDRIDFIPRFTMGVTHVDGVLPKNSVHNLLGLISGQIRDYIEKLEYHFEHDLGELLRQ